MANKKGMGLFTVLVDAPAEHEEELNRWYNEEHIAENLAVPGVLDGARYVAVTGAPKYLACYELEGPEVMEHEAFKTMAENPSGWTKRMISPAMGVTFKINCYQQIFPAEVSQEASRASMAPALLIACGDVPPEVEHDFNDWYNSLIKNYIEKVPGCIRARRYRSVTGEPKYAVVYEMENEGVSQKPEWPAARDAHPLSARMRPQQRLAAGSPGIYKKISPQ